MDIKPIDPELIPDELVAIDGPLDGTVSSITIELSNGTQVEVAPPPVFTVNLLAQIFSDSEKFDQLSYVYAKAAMWVQSINGVPQSRPTSKPELQVLQNKLLDEGLDQVIQVMNEYFPQANGKTSLKVVKKNLR